MHFKKNSDVLTHEKNLVGQIDRVVIDPATDEVSHLVVQKGFFFTEDKVVPITDIETNSGEAVILKKTAAPDDYSEFDETQYVPNGGVEDFNRRQTDEARKLLWYHSAVKAPNLKSAPYPSDHKPLYHKKTHRHIPDDAVALEEGADVLDTDGKQLGTIEDIYAEEETFKITHVLVSTGMIKKDRKLVPVNWIKDIDEDAVQLHINSRVFENLPNADIDEA
ncbi:MAG: PRC-barrel domain-containing protein [Desulfobacteraceae bacterium]|nr:PRC-barrel domain-containing protein [Desulfobacteraceae bacterium]